MSGYPDYNRPAFNAAAAKLRAAGFEVVNPAELDAQDPTVTEWADYLRRDIRALMDCDKVAVLPGWELSRGATLEVHIAQSLHMTVMPISRWVGEVKP